VKNVINNKHFCNTKKRRRRGKVEKEQMNMCNFKSIVA
jgi:hypothetical protein